MADCGKPAWLGESPAGRHVCQFHSPSDPLAESIAIFAEAGLRGGDQVILLALPDQAEAALAVLEPRAVDLVAARATGQLRIEDSCSVLDACAAGSGLDLERLSRYLGGMLARTSSGPRRKVRVYGDMVSLLWNRGDAELAIHLEEIWDELVQAHPSTVLFCGYSLDRLAESTYNGPLSGIGRVHRTVLTTADDERFQTAVDAATHDVLGISFSTMLSSSTREQALGDHRLPMGWRTLHWLHRNMPVTSAHILERARHYMASDGAPVAR